MDARIAALTTAFADYTKKVDEYVTAAEQHKTDVAAAVAEAVVKDNASEDVDFQALQAAIAAAAAKVPAAPVAPVFEPSNL